MADPKTPPPIPTLDKPIIPGGLDSRGETTERLSAPLPAEPETPARISPSLPAEPKVPTQPPTDPGDLKAWIEAMVTRVLERHMQAAQREITERLLSEIQAREAGGTGSHRD
jgi:hypothetical protein